MTSNADNAKLAWPGDGMFDNPWAGTFSTRDDHRVSKTLLDTLNALNDPRMKIYAQPTKTDPTKYVGLQNGLDNVTVTPFFNTTSRIGAIFYPGSTTYGTFGTSAGKTTPSYIMTFAEVSFLQRRGGGARTGWADGRGGVLQRRRSRLDPAVGRHRRGCRCVPRTSLASRTSPARPV